MKKFSLIFDGIILVLLGVQLGLFISTCIYDNTSEKYEQSVVSEELYSCSVEVEDNTKEYLEIQPVSQQLESSEVKKEPYFYLSDYERSVVEKIVSGEAGGESAKGQMLVAQCILDACIKDEIQPSQVRVNYGYKGWNESVSETTKEAVSKVFDDGELPIDAPILYFYNPKWGWSKFHESQRFVIKEGNHKFFAEW